jgi:hypothetical protein
MKFLIVLLFTVNTHTWVVPGIHHSAVYTYTDTCKTDSLKRVLFVANYKIERVKYYLKICQRNPKQVKFLVSWINRAIK